MTVIKDEFKTGEITRHDVLPLSFLKKSAYTGSKKQLSYKMEKTEIKEAGEGEEEKTRLCLRVYYWKGYYSFEDTDSELIHSMDFSFDENGIDEAVEFLNNKLKEL